MLVFTTKKPPKMYVTFSNFQNRHCLCVDGEQLLVLGLLLFVYKGCCINTVAVFKHCSLMVVFKILK